MSRPGERAIRGPGEGKDCRGLRRLSGPNDGCRRSAQCPLPVQVSGLFLWLSFAIPFGCVIAIMDLVTGFSMGLIKGHMERITGVLAAIDDFFDMLGCEGY